MNPGLPGTGIGGLFYILVALCMPACEVLRRWQGGATRRGTLVAKQFASALGGIAALSGGFWGLETVVMLDRVAAHAGSRRAQRRLVAARIGAGGDLGRARHGAERGGIRAAVPAVDRDAARSSMRASGALLILLLWAQTAAGQTLLQRADAAYASGD